MKQKEHYSLGMSSENKFNILGMIILLVCIIGFIKLDSTFSRIFLSIFTACGLIFFMVFNGIEIDYKKVEARHYLNFFILKIYSDTINLKNYNKVILKLYHEISSVRSMSTSGKSNTRTRSFDIYLVSKEGNILISQIENYKESKKFLVKIAKRLNIPFENTYETSIKNRKRPRR